MEPSRYEHQNSNERLRVLIVDDDLALRNILYKILENGGYDVLSASSGPEALAICRRSSPRIDLLVTDYNMPGMSGLELGRECAALNPVLPMLFISGDYPDHELRAEVEKGNRGFLAKPFRGEGLMRKVKEMLLMHPEPAWPAHQQMNL